MKKYKITVCTPTYNRAYILPHLYESLQNQSFTDFEWLIIDDGSVDETEELVNVWCNEQNRFEVNYHKQKNGGKHRAVNTGIDLAQGTIFFVMDSDDILTPDALEKVNIWFRSIEKQQKIIGVVGNKGRIDGSSCNHYFEKDYIDASFLEMNSYLENGKPVLAGERAICFYTECIKKYKYPEIEGENFITEAVVYNRIAHDGYKVRFYNDIIWLFDYRDDGLTNKGIQLFLDNPKGYGLWVKEQIVFRNMNTIDRIKRYYAFMCDMENRYQCNEIASCLKVSPLLIRLLHAVHYWKRKLCNK